MRAGIYIAFHANLSWTCQFVYPNTRAVRNTRFFDFKFRCQKMPSKFCLLVLLGHLFWGIQAQFPDSAMLGTSSSRAARLQWAPDTSHVSERLGRPSSWLKCIEWRAAAASIWLHLRENPVRTAQLSPSRTPDPQRLWTNKMVGCAVFFLSR